MDYEFDSPPEFVDAPGPEFVDAPGPPGGMYSDANQTAMNLRHPSTMTEDEIALGLLKLDPEKWKKFKGGTTHRLGGPLNEVFTKPGSFMTRAGGPTINSLIYGIKKAKRAAGSMVGSVLPESLGGPGSGADIGDEIYQRLEDINQNLNQGRPQGKEGFDPASMLGQAAFAAAGSRGTPVGSLPARLSANAALAGGSTYATTPGNPQERAGAALTAGGLTAGLQGGTELVKKPAKRGAKWLLQKVLNVTEQDQRIAAERAAQYAALNETLGTNLEPTVAQLTGSPGYAKLESASEKIPFGMAEVRRAGNRENAAMVRNWSNKLQNELRETPWGSRKELMDAFVKGDENAARVLNLLDSAGDDAAMVAKASPEAAMFPKRQSESSLYNKFKSLASKEEKVDLGAELTKIDSVLDDLTKIAGPDHASVRSLKKTRDDLVEAMSHEFPGPQKRLPSSFGENPNTGAITEYPGELIPRPPYNADAAARLSPGSLRETISDLGNEAARYRGSANPGDAQVAGLIDQVRTPIKQRFLEAIANAKNANVRTALEAAQDFSAGQIHPWTRTTEARALGNIDLPDKVIPSFVKKNQPGLGEWFSGALEDKGRAAVRAQIGKDVVSSGDSVGMGASGYFDNAKAASLLEQLPTESFFEGASKAELDQLAKILRWTDANARISQNPVNGASVAPLAVGGMLMSGARGLVGATGMGPIVKKLMATPEGKSWLLTRWQNVSGTKPVNGFFPRLMGTISGQGTEE